MASWQQFGTKNYGGFLCLCNLLSIDYLFQEDHTEKTAIINRP